MLLDLWCWGWWDGGQRGKVLSSSSLLQLEKQFYIFRCRQNFLWIKKYTLEIITVMEPIQSLSWVWYRFSPWIKLLLAKWSWLYYFIFLSLLFCKKVLLITIPWFASKLIISKYLPHRLTQKKFKDFRAFVFTVKQQ